MKALLITLFLFLVACSSETASTTDFEGVAMTIPYTIKVGDSLNIEQKKRIESCIKNTFSAVDAIFNNYNPSSEISQLGALPAYKKVTLSMPLREVLEMAHRVHRISDGKFDPTVEPLAKEWKAALKFGKKPDPQKLKFIQQSVGWEHIHLGNGTFWKDCSSTSIDLGGIAKGYAVDMLAENLQSIGIKNLYVEWGGEIRTSGLHPSKRKWNIAIAGITTLEMNDQALATSGNYAQSWNVEGVCYTHIIDPRTKEPLQVAQDAISSTSVLGKSCALCDAIATTLMLFPTSEEALAWAQDLHFEVWIAKNTQ